MTDANRPTDSQSDQVSENYDQKKASAFIENTPLETMIEIADEAVRRKREEKAKEGPKWVFPEGGINPNA
ncbi:MAG: hypothetical protein AAF703_16870 [Cyanobacteria bacterium P01_D01_bin.105]